MEIRLINREDLDIMVQGAVFFDIDGTLVDETQNIFYPTQKSINAINILKENGYYVFLASGRAKCYMPECNIDFDGYVLSNGAYAEIRGETIHDIKLDKLFVDELIEELEKIGMCYALENQDMCYTNGLRDSHFLNMLELFKINKSAFSDINGERSANKLLISYNSEKDAIKLAKRFKNRLVISGHRNNLSGDADAAGITKATGVKAVIDKLLLPQENTYAFGDGANDYDMLKTVGHGIAMGDHHRSLDNVCEFVTESVVNEGIYEALKKLHLV